jgi:hypothetical protein
MSHSTQLFKFSVALYEVILKYISTVLDKNIAYAGTKGCFGKVMVVE